MRISIDGLSYDIGALAIAFRYAACETTDEERRTALLAIADAVDALAPHEGGSEMEAGEAA